MPKKNYSNYILNIPEESSLYDYMGKFTSFRVYGASDPENTMLYLQLSPMYKSLDGNEKEEIENLLFNQLEKEVSKK